MPFVKKSKATRDSEKLSGEQREKKLSELEGEYKKYWDARSKLLEAETDETKSSTSSSTTASSTEGPQQKARLLQLQARLSLANTRSSL